MDDKVGSKPNSSGIKRIFKAFNCSVKGFKAAYVHEAAFRQELLLCAFLLPISFIIATSMTHWLILISTLLFLLFAEVINSAIEALADRISIEHHELIGRAKDLGSAAVFIAFSILAVCWLSIAYIFLTTL